MITHCLTFRYQRKKTVLICSLSAWSTLMKRMTFLFTLHPDCRITLDKSPHTTHSLLPQTTNLFLRSRVKHTKQLTRSTLNVRFLFLSCHLPSPWATLPLFGSTDAHTRLPPPPPSDLIIHIQSAAPFIHPCISFDTYLSTKKTITLSCFHLEKYFNI